jgi:hypothetical protein
VARSAKPHTVALHAPQLRVVAEFPDVVYVAGGLDLAIRTDRMAPDEPLPEPTPRAVVSALCARTAPILLPPVLLASASVYQFRATGKRARPLRRLWHWWPPLPVRLTPDLCRRAHWSPSITRGTITSRRHCHTTGRPMLIGLPSLSESRSYHRSIQTASIDTRPFAHTCPVLPLLASGG